jgi:alpha-N-acetylglucosaminidase
MRATFLFLLAILAARLGAGEFPGVEALAARRVPWLRGHVRFERLDHPGGAAFELRTEKGALVVAATDASAAAEGLGWYLKYSCHRSMSHLGDNLGPVTPLPVLEHPVAIEASARYRYALNYCTFNYTMSFYSWGEWERELDWMALSGVNLMLVANGEEAVWRNALRRLGSTEAEIAAFIPGPGYTAWWLMGNLEGFGGPMSAAMIDRRSELQARMITRMRALGIEPLVPGFYGMVPASLKARLKAHILPQGAWASFRRPDILDPTDPEFARVAAVYYEEVASLYGNDLRFFSGDPFHEGGIMTGVDLGRSGQAIQAAMQRRFPGAVWVLQGWLDNPRKELLAGMDRSHVLVQELFGEKTHNWETRQGYEGTPFLWCCIDDFGERPGPYGRLQRFADETYRARTGEFGRFMEGVGIMPEGIDNNPVAYDLALELGWHSEHVDVARWIEGYAAYRYGRPDPDLAAAWSLLLQTVYSSKFDGAPENVLCARPRTPAGPVTPWGSLFIGYDQALFAKACDLFAKAEGRFAGSETYHRDWVTLKSQALSNEAYGAALRLDAAIAAGKRDAFEDSARDLLRLGAETDALQGTVEAWRLSTYQARALRYGRTPAEKRESLRNAMMLVTYWGGEDRSTDMDNDYAYKDWGGMMRAYYLERWTLYLDYQRSLWAGNKAAPPDFYGWERTWVDGVCQAAHPELP